MDNKELEKFKNNRFYPLMDMEEEEEDKNIILDMEISKLNEDLRNMKICREFFNNDDDNIIFYWIDKEINNIENKIKNINLSISTNDKNLKRKVEEINNENPFKKPRNQGCGIYF
jgi:hypothetical protein